MWRFVSFCRSPFARIIRRGFFIFVLAIFCLTCLPTLRAENLSTTEFDKEIDQRQKGLVNVKRKISRQKNKARKMEKEEVYIISRLSRLDKALDISKTALKKIRKELKEKKRESEKLSGQLVGLEDNFTARREVIAQRLVGIFKAKRLGFANLIWSSRSFTEFWRRYKLIKQITAADGELFNKLKTEHKNITLQKAAIEKKGWDISNQEEEEKQKLRQLAKNQKKKKILLNDVRRRKKIYLIAAAELEDAAKNLKGLINKLSRDKNNFLTNRYGDSPVYQKKGKLPWPTNGVVSREFGRQKHPEFGTMYDYQGIDINAPLGQPVKAVAAGVIRYADWFRGYGKIAITDHKAGFYTLYGHLNEIKVKAGEKIEAGTIIGTVGDTGSMRGAYLYFEIRQSGQQLNPRQWLSKK